MACLQMVRSDFSPMLRLHYGLTLRRRAVAPTVHFRCCLRQNGGDAKGDEPPESLFMKELKKRGMNPATLLEDASYAQGEQERAAKEENSGGLGKAKRNKVASAEYEKGASGQRERSMALNSEGIQGLIPRAKLLLTIGGTFFLGFWPLMLITISAFAALYYFFGTSFVHDASKISVLPPPYIDPYQLLEDERISQIAPNLSGVFAGVLPASLGGGKQRAAVRCFSGGGGGGSIAAECSSRSQKKGTAHHMKTRPKKTQPWDVKRKGPTFYPKLPPLPPDWTLVSSGDGEGDNGTIVSQQQQKEEEGLLPAITATDAF